LRERDRSPDSPLRARPCIVVLEVVGSRDTLGPYPDVDKTKFHFQPSFCLKGVPSLRVRIREVSIHHTSIVLRVCLLRRQSSRVAVWRAKRRPNPVSMSRAMESVQTSMNQSHRASKRILGPADCQIQLDDDKPGVLPARLACDFVMEWMSANSSSKLGCDLCSV
jgi:hypothetical protein